MIDFAGSHSSSNTSSQSFFDFVRKSSTALGFKLETHTDKKSISAQDLQDNPQTLKIAKQLCDPDNNKNLTLEQLAKEFDTFLKHYAEHKHQAFRDLITSTHKNISPDFKHIADNTVVYDKKSLAMQLEACVAVLNLALEQSGIKNTKVVYAAKASEKEGSMNMALAYSSTNDSPTPDFPSKAVNAYIDKLQKELFGQGKKIPRHWEEDTMPVTSGHNISVYTWNGESDLDDKKIKIVKAIVHLNGDIDPTTGIGYSPPEPEDGYPHATIAIPQHVFHELMKREQTKTRETGI